ncbi:MAG: ribosome small subunit-dependent GTPase A [Balneolaceae bacterium]|nr:ribosome small subunit-dependent GTPase A [Balneolaceae bacterium]
MDLKGRVVRSTGSWYEVELRKNGSRDVIDCRLPGRFRLEEEKTTNPVAVGDYVTISINEDGTGTIDKIHERENYIIRKSTHGKEEYQVLAANVDRGFAVQSIRKPKFKQIFVDRFLVTCEAYEVEPCIIINKMDLADEKDRRRVEYIKDIYEPLGYLVLTTSIYDTDSLQALEEELEGYTSVLVGHSGVGKTSLLNKIDPGIDRPVGEVSSYSEKGIHTTTFAKLLRMENGGYIVDTPGIKELGLVEIEPWELSLFFPEMLEPRQHCKFNNCTHSHEPGCGVIEAVEREEISPERYESYLQILDTLKNN